MSQASRQISASRVVAASPEAIFAVLASPAGHAAIDGSGTVRKPRAARPAERTERS